jgi:hypothetical protein
LRRNSTHAARRMPALQGMTDSFKFLHPPP